MNDNRPSIWPSPNYEKFEIMKELNKNLEIFPIPKIDERILDAVRSDELVLFIGAGISRLLGCKGWEEVAHELIKYCHNAGLINFKEMETLLKKHDPKKNITICHSLLKESEKETDFFEKLSELLKYDTELSEKYKIYKNILDFNAILITTNADKCLFLETGGNSNSIRCRVEDFSDELLTHDKIYHIHGFIDDPKTLVFTVRQYLERYIEPNMHKFLKYVFNKKTVLFLGYGLEEFELLDYLILNCNSEKSRTHFILLPYFSNEENILSIDRKYYNELGVQVIPYALDKKGYHQQVDIFEDWNKEINSELPLSFEFREKVETLAENWDTDIAKTIICSIRPNSHKEILFFQILNEHSSGEVWFNLLNSSNYFEPERVFSIKAPLHIIWYLKQVNTKLSSDNNIELAISITNTIRNLVNYQISNRYKYPFYNIIILILIDLPFKDIKDLFFDYLSLIIDIEKSLTLIENPTLGSNECYEYNI